MKFETYAPYIDFSQQDKIIGKWYNGSDMYSKVLTYTYSNITTINDTKSLTGIIPNGKELVFYNYCVIRNDHQVCMFDGIWFNYPGHYELRVQANNLSSSNSYDLYVYCYYI